MSKSEDHEVEYEQESTVPVEAFGAAVGAGILGLTSTVLTNFVDITGSNILDAAIIGVGGAALGRVGAVRGVEAYLGPDPRANTDITDSCCLIAKMAATGSAAWLGWTQYAGGMSAASVLALVAGAAATAIAVWFQRRKMAAITEDVLEAERAAYAERMERERIGDWGVILKRAGFRRKIKDADGNEHEELSLDIVDQGDIHDDSLGTTIGVWARVTGEPEDFAKLFWENVEHKIGTAAQKVIGEGGEGVDITTASVSIDRDRKAGYAQINILTVDILDGISDFQLKPHEIDSATGKPLPADPTEPFDVGRHPNGKRVTIKKWRRHMEIIGESQSGKSSLINLLFERMTRSRNAVVWVGGSWKVWRMVGSWIGGMTYEGGSNPCVFDWVAPTQERVLEMLATAYEYADMRESDPEFQSLGEDNPSEKWPAIEIVLDEVHKILKHPGKIRCHDGIDRNASELIDELTSGATSAFVHVTMATQAALMADLGEVGNRIKGNISISVAFKSGRDDWLNKTIPTINPIKNQTHLGSKGTFFLKQPGVPGWLSKADYIRPGRIPAMAAVRAHMRGTIPEEHWSRFTVGTYPDKETGKPTQANAYARRFVYGDGTREDFIEAIRLGSKFKKGHQMAGAGARGGSSSGGGPLPGTPEYDREVLGLDPDMSMEDALRNMDQVFRKQKIERAVSDQSTVDERFAALMGEMGLDGNLDAGGDDDAGGDGDGDGGGAPEEVIVLLESIAEFDTVTTREAAVIFGLLDEDEDDPDTIQASARDAADRVYELFGLRTDQPRDRQKRHGNRRPRGWKVEKLQAAARQRYGIDPDKLN